MLSRRDKLLLQPWDERRFKDHRLKVQAARAAIDAGAPPPRPHVALKLKQCRRELDRARQVQRDNFGLLQRLATIMRVNRLDNHWPKPLPKFQHKVGLFYDAAALGARLAARGRPRAPGDSCHYVRCYACDLNKKKYGLGTFEPKQREFLPSLNIN